MIPELLPEPDLTQPAQTDEPVPGTPEDDALQQVIKEMSKLPPEPTAVMTGKDDPARLLMDSIPTLLQLVGELQQTNAANTQLMAIVQADHKEIHALQKRVSHLENVLARSSTTESDPAMDLPSPIPPPEQAASAIEVIE